MRPRPRSSSHLAPCPAHLRNSHTPACSRTVTQLSGRDLSPLLWEPLQVLPPLVGLIPEARLNLVVFYLRRGDAGRAANLVRGLEPATAFEFICKVGRALRWLV